jgi:hypothetical protein
MLAQRAGVQVTFALVYALVAMVFLLAAVWAGLRFADNLVAPIDALYVINFLHGVGEAGEGGGAGEGEGEASLATGAASELGSLVTFAGLITAGLAVAMQSILVSVVGYFFLIGKYGIRAVMGKGGMGPKTLAGLKQHGAVYLNAVGGAAQFYARCIERVDGVSLQEFGTPEAMWHLWLKDFPAVVTMDSHGNSLHQDIEQASARELAALATPGH